MERNLQELYFNINNHLLNDARPSVYLNEAYDLEVFKKPPFNMLYKLKNTEQSRVHHPEGNVWNHTMLVVDEASKNKSKSKEPSVFMWAALLHDIGKPICTKIINGKITAYNHEKIGSELAVEFLKKFTDDNAFIQKVAGLIRYHMQILFVVNDLPFSDIRGMKKNSDIYEVSLLGLCDRLGRAKCDRHREERNITAFLKKCSMYNAR